MTRRIAYVIDSIAGLSSGTEQQLYMLLKRLDRTRFEPIVVCLRSSEWLESNSLPCEVHILHLRSLMSTDFVRALMEFRQIHQRTPLDIVQTFFFDADIFGIIASHSAGIKTIIASRRNIGYWHTTRYRILLRLLGRWTWHYLANSEAAAQATRRAEGVLPSKITVIPNGLNLEEYKEVPPEVRTMQRTRWGVRDDEVIVGCVSNLRRVKNIDGMIEAARTLVSDRDDLRFIVVGEGPFRSELERRIGVAGLHKRFTLVGQHSTIASCLAAFDVAVLPSHSESLSNALIEYMASGLPIVASNVGGNTELISRDHTGLLFDPKNPEDLARCVGRLLSRPDVASRLGSAAKQYALSTFDEQRCIQLHESFYLRISDKPHIAWQSISDTGLGK